MFRNTAILRCKIPKVKKFQRNNNLNPDVADSEYMQLALETKKAVIDGVYRKDSTFPPIEFGVSRPEYDPVREKTHHLVELLTDFSMLKVDELEVMSGNESGVRMERIEASLIMKETWSGLKSYLTV